MSNTTSFEGKNGNISSMRTTVNYGDNKSFSTNYNMSGKSMTTFDSGNFTTRLNGQGQAMTTAISSNSGTSYYGSGLSSKNNLGTIE